MKKGFTLVEILAVITILSIILIIAIPGISNIILDNKKDAFLSSAKSLLRNIDYINLEENNMAEVSLSTLNIKGLSSEDYNLNSSTVYMENGLLYINLVGDGKFEGLYVCNLTLNTKTNVVVEDDCNVYDMGKGVNKPVLLKGMTPVKWNGSSWVNTTNSDSEWYDYDNKKWANATTSDGSMWVWIPRYIYKISANWHTNTVGTIDIKFTKGLDDNWNSSVVGSIEIGTTSNTSNNKWTNHPAFTFGDKELYGIWVAKFESTAAEGVVNPFTSDGSCASTEDNVTTKTVKVLPNQTAWRCITISNVFTTVRNMETKNVYGWDLASGLNANGTFTVDTNNLDVHLMKSIEWGAVSYLSKSTYGKQTEEIFVNNSQTFITGCSGTAVNSGAYVGCQNEYSTAGGVKASTTGNIYGIYDLSGGAWEYQSAYVNNSNSGQGAVVKASLTKYKDVYPITTDGAVLNYDSSINLKGDAIYETSSTSAGSTSWYGDYSGMPSGGNLYFVKGGRFANGNSCGAFAFGSSWGGVNSTNSFRPVISPGEGL